MTATKRRADKSRWSLWRLGASIGAAASAGVLVWALIEHWQAFLAWKAGAGFWPFFAGLTLLPLVGVPVTPMLVLAGATFELLPALAGCSAAIALNLVFSHWLARRWLRDWLLRLAAWRRVELPTAGSGGRLSVLLLVRLTPGLPLALKNYVGALVPAPFAAYLAIFWTATLLYAIGLIVLGDSLKNASLTEAAVAVGILIAVLAGVFAIRERLRTNRESESRMLPTEDGEIDP